MNVHPDLVYCVINPDLNEMYSCIGVLHGVTDLGNQTRRIRETFNVYAGADRKREIIRKAF